MDAFGTNNPLGSSSGKDKIMGMYYSPFVSLQVGSKRSTIQTIALLEAKDIENLGLKYCLQSTMLELRSLVINGIYDAKTEKNIDVRIIASLGDNLEQVNIAGMLQNFSTLEHSCRKCLASLTDLRNAESFSDIHPSKFMCRSDEMMQENYLESKEKM